MLKKIMYFVISSSLFLLSVNASAALINCRGMNKKVSIEECNDYKKLQREKIKQDRFEKLEQKRKVDEAQKVQREREREERDAERLLEKEERSVKRAKELEERKQRNAEIAAKREQERLAREEARKKRDEERDAKRLLEKEERNSKRTIKDEEVKEKEVSSKSDEENKQVIVDNQVIKSTKVDAFIRKYKGNSVDDDGYYGAQCVDLMRRYTKEVFDGTNFPTAPSAIAIFNKMSSDWRFRKVLISDGEFPKKGDVIFLKATTKNPYGHVAIVTRADKFTVESLDQNVCTDFEHGPGTGLCAPRLISRAYTEVAGWMSPI